MRYSLEETSMKPEIIALTWVPFGVFVMLALVLALHHLYIHSLNRYDKAREESVWWCCYLQLSDISNHEVWVICLLCSATTWVAAAYTFHAWADNKALGI